MPRHAQYSLGRLELFCLFAACSCTSGKAKVLWCRFSWVWSDIPKVLFFILTSICIMLDFHWSYNYMLFWDVIVRHRLSTNQIVRCFKLRNLKNYVSYQVDFLLPLKLRKTCYFGLSPRNTLDQSVCRFFYFWLF